MNIVSITLLAMFAFTEGEGEGEGQFVSLCEFETYGEGTASSNASAPQIEGFGFPAVGQQIRVQLRGAPSKCVAILTLGTASASIPLGGGHTGLIDPTQPTQIFSRITDKDGFASQPITVPGGPSTVDTDFYFQWVVTNNNGAIKATSDGLGTRIKATPYPMYTTFHVGTTLTAKTSGQGTQSVGLSGELVIKTSPGPDFDHVKSEMVHLALYGKGLVDPEIGPTGHLELRAANTAMALVTPQSLHQFEVPLELGLRFHEQVNIAAAVQDDKPDASGSLVAQRFPGVVKLTRDTEAGWGALSFEQTGASIGAGIDASTTILLKGEVDDDDKTSKAEQKKELCVRIHLVGKALHTSTVFGQIASALQDASQLWCDQCCIGLKVELKDESNPNQDPAEWIDLIDNDDLAVVDGPVENDEGELEPSDEMNELCMQNPSSDPDCIDIYFVGRLLKGDAPGAIVGFATTIGGCGCIIIQARTDETVAHEIGHALGLGHVAEEDEDPDGDDKDNLMSEAGNNDGDSELNLAQCEQARAGNSKLKDKECEMCDCLDPAEQ